ncbi:MAG: hypothetical protein R6U98_01875 [Pirellulaceae bacterium]
MKQLLLLFSLLLTFSTVQAQTVEKEVDSTQESVDLIRDLLSQQSVPVTNIEAECVSKNIMEVRFQNNTKEPIDIEYYAPAVHTEWQHSIARYLDYIPSDAESARIGVAYQGQWLIRITQGEWSSDAVSVDTIEEEEAPVEKTEKKITVIESDKSVLNTPVPNGLIRHNGKYRLYFFERNNEEMLYAESNDLESWTSYKKAGFNTGGGANLIQDENGQVYLYEGEGDRLYIHEVNGSNLDRLENKRFAYEWRIDGKLVISIHDGTWYATGRVRGSGSRSEGGWGGELPPYPELSELPFIRQEYDKHLPSYRNPDDYLKDRRGISLHTSPDGKTWSEGNIIADPMDYTQTPFRGWTVEGAEGIGDFYSSLMFDGKRMIVKAYMKEKDRVIDRWDYSPDMRIERRFRFTGETILIPAVYRNGQVEIVSTESIIPRSYHERKTPTDLDYVTCTSCVEVGQLSNGNEIIRKDGYVYITYGYRDDVHYEGHGWNYYTGVYLYRIPEEAFDQLFN